jgi:hypothetical protein
LRGLCWHYAPSLAVVGSWFVRRRSTALGVAASGTGCGMLVMPPLAAALIADFGWREACVLVGCGSGFLLVVAAAMVRSAPLATTKAARSLGAVVHSIPFVCLLYVSWICATTALFIPFVFLPVFARQNGATPLAASMLLSLIGIMSVIGRLGFGPAFWCSYHYVIILTNSPKPEAEYEITSFMIGQAHTSLTSTASCLAPAASVSQKWRRTASQALPIWFRDGTP